MPPCALASARCAFFPKVALSLQRGAPSDHADQFVGVFFVFKMALSSAPDSRFENAALACAGCPFLTELPKTVIFWRVDLALWPRNGALACAACAFVRLASAACSFLTRPPFSASKWCSRLRGVRISETVLSPAPGVRFWKPRSRLDGACV